MPNYPKLFPPIDITFPDFVRTSVLKIPAETYCNYYLINKFILGKMHLSLLQFPSYPASPLPHVYNFP